MCQPDWFGSYCQKRNIARGKSTRQSSELQGYGGPFPSNKAVDGNTDQTLEHGSCTHTGDTTSTGEWWRVDINTTLEIRRMRIYLRSDNTDRNMGLQVMVGDQLCYTLSEDNRQQTVLNITCGEALSGSSITISVNGPYLTLCEVQIFQCSERWFGDDCDKQCQCQNTAEVCDKETGNCRGGCAAGKHGPGCQQECNDGWFGSDCNKQCKCLTASEACNKETGHCSSGCAAGKQGPGCQQECSDGWFGSDCDKQCQCQDTTEVCNRETGNCRSGCTAGKQGLGCQQDCGQHLYGVNCSFMCGQCSGTSDCKKDDGNCTQGCQQGYSPPMCTMCAVHFYGPPCQGCGHCKDDSPCSVLNGTCLTGCKPGYEPPLCSTACPAGSYGSPCRECGHCQDKTNCSRQDGTCSTGCEAGYQHPLCHETCIPGRYGEGCLHTCGHFQINGSCNAQTGRCENNCQPGYMGPLCIQECADYTYGINCSGVCSCLNQCEVCDKVTGECRTGHQSTTTAAAGALAAHQGQGYDDVRLIVVSCLLAISCVYAVLTTATIYRIRRSMKIPKAEQMQQYSTLQVRWESSVYDVIAERSVYANESIQRPRDGDQDPNKN